MRVVMKEMMMKPLMTVTRVGENAYGEHGERFEIHVSFSPSYSSLRLSIITLV
jgi:hypothetical protein